QFPLFTAFQSETEIVCLCSVSLHSTETKSDRSLPRSSRLSFCREQLGHYRDKGDGDLEYLKCAHIRIVDTNKQRVTQVQVATIVKAEFDAKNQLWKLKRAKSDFRDKEEEEAETNSTNLEEAETDSNIQEEVETDSNNLEAAKTDSKNHLKYAYLDDHQHFPIIVANNLNQEQEENLLSVLRKHKNAIGWTLADLPRINPSICMHKILLEEEAQPIRQQQRKLNPTILDVVKKEVTRLLATEIIYPILDSQWVSPVQVVPKKSKMIVMKNRHDEMVPTRIQNSWRVCIDYRKLNQTTCKDHFLLSFIDQIHIASVDQYKTTFTCLFGTFAYTRMSFGLCNAPKGIVLGHLISSRGIEVDKAKVDIIASLPNPASVWKVRFFLGYTCFYRRFIKNFSKITLPLSKLLQKDVNFIFNQPCDEAF
ncbi:putative mitochondrial protein, partial [Mucuna pruriens]